MAVMEKIQVSKIRCYSELKQLETFEDRYQYLKLSGTVGQDTFGCDRYLNQGFYKSREWKNIRKLVIARDNGCDLGIPGRDIQYGLHIHHMNPIRAQDILDQSKYLLDPEYLICVSSETHNAIHYGDEESIIRDPVQRTPGDTCPWRKSKEEKTKWSIKSTEL